MKQKLCGLPTDGSSYLESEKVFPCYVIVRADESTCCQIFAKEGSTEVPRKSSEGSCF